MKKLAIVTGAGSWIGRQIAIELASSDIQLMLLGRTLSKLQETANIIQETGGKSTCFELDLSNEEEVKDFADNLLSEVNILVHAAAIYPRNRIEDLTRKEWDQVIITNLSSSYQLVHSLLPKIPKNQNSRIIFVSSVAGSVIGPRTLSAYSASKAGVDGLMKSLASELGPEAITVNSVLPGNILNVDRFSPSEEQKDIMKKAIPTRQFGKPQDIAHAVSFLVSEKSSFINGHMLVVDGGETISNWK